MDRQFTFGTSTPLHYLASYIQTEGGASAAQGATVTSMFGAGTIFGRILLGQMADYKGWVAGLQCQTSDEHLLTQIDCYRGPMNIFLVAVFTAGVLQLCMWLPAGGNVTVAATFAFLYGFFGLGGLSVSNSVIATHLDPNKFASLSGVFFTSEIAVSRLYGVDAAERLGPS